MLLLFCFAFLGGCSKRDFERSIEPSTIVDNKFSAELKNVGVRQGVLSFNDIKEFRAFYNFILDYQMNVDFLLKFIRENFDFVSAREVFEGQINNIEHPTEFLKAAESNPNVFEKINIGGEFYYDLAFSNVSSYFFNRECKVIIGDTLIVARKEGTYLFEIGRDPEIGNLESDSNDFRFIPKEFETFGPKNHFSYKTAYFSNSRRIVARLYLHEIYYPGIGIMYEYDARTTGQRRYLGAWIQNRIDLIGFKHEYGSITYQSSISQFVNPADFFLFGRADISQTLAYGSYIDPIVHAQSTLMLTHYGTWDSEYGYREITENELFR